MSINKTEAIVFIQEIKNTQKTTRYYKKQVKKMLQKELDLNMKYDQGKTLLHYIIEKNHSKLLPFLIERGSNPNLCDDHFVSPMHLAVEKNNRKAVKYLVYSGADIDIPGEFEQTPLHRAVILGDEKMIKTLIALGADVLLVDEKNLSVMDYAKDEKNQNIVSFLEKAIYKKKGEER